MIVDAHVHYDIWSGGMLPIEELLADASAAGVDRIVQATNSRAVWDNGPSLRGAAEHPDKVLGVIGRFDPRPPEVQRRLKECMAPPAMLGIRLQPQGGGDTWLRDGVFDPTFEAAQNLGVILQMAPPFQVSLMHEKVRRYRGVRFLIDHMGLSSEDASDEKSVFQEWPNLMKLGAEPNAWIKVSEFPTAVCDFEKYPYPTAQRYFRELYERIGASKLIWGSHYPSIARACTYKESLDFVREHCTFLSVPDRKAILGGNFLETFMPKG